MKYERSVNLIEVESEIGDPSFLIYFIDIVLIFICIFVSKIIL